MLRHASSILVFAAALVLSPRIARADDIDPVPSSASGATATATTSSSPPTAGRGAWKSFRAGSTLVQSVPTAAILDGVWSISLHITTELTNRTWDSPYPWGTLGQYSTRLLYGTSWTLMLGFESLAVLIASKGKFDWLAEAAYRTQWIVPVTLPSCEHSGAAGGCGVGAGSYSFIQIRPVRSKWWYEAGGGWIQQRVANDSLRTLAESSWVLTPISVVREWQTDPDRDIAWKAFVGPGAYFGMHAAHLHPTVRGQEIYTHIPWTEMYPLDAGIGPGGRVEGRMTIKQRISVEADVVVAPFLLGGPTTHVSHYIAPLDFERDGFSVWRKVTAGIGYQDPKELPFKATLAFFGAELSSRPIDRIGYRGGMIRFDIPLKVPKD